MFAQRCDNAVTRVLFSSWVSVICTMLEGYVDIKHATVTWWDHTFVGMVRSGGHP